MLKAFRYGAPPHGGVAMGLDRLIMVLAGKDSLRDVTAFPKAQSGLDPMTGAPAHADAVQLAEMGIAVIVPDEQDNGL
jgi:aspartyl-tRNA synthetase